MDKLIIIVLILVGRSYFVAVSGLGEGRSMHDLCDWLMVGWANVGRVS